MKLGFFSTRRGGCSDNHQCPERPRQGSDQPSKEAQLGALLQVCDEQNQEAASGQGWEGDTARGCFLLRRQRTSASLSLVPRPHLPRAVCRASGNRAGQGTQYQESQEDKDMFVWVLGTGSGRRAQGRSRLPAEAGARNTGSRGGALGVPEQP